MLNFNSHDLVYKATLMTILCCRWMSSCRITLGWNVELKGKFCWLNVETHERSHPLWTRIEFLLSLENVWSTKIMLSIYWLTAYSNYMLVDLNYTILNLAEKHAKNYENHWNKKSIIRWWSGFNCNSLYI